MDLLDVATRWILCDFNIIIGRIIMNADHEYFEAQIHRTWLELLIAANYTEVAAIAVNTEFCIYHPNYTDVVIYVDLPASSYIIVQQDDSIKDLIRQTISIIADNRIDNENGYTPDKTSIIFRVKLVEPEDNWKETIKEVIIRSRNSNQGIISEKLFNRDNKSVYVYNEMKFASQSEIRIAQELEKRKILFFPLPLAVRTETGLQYKDHREVDFLICQDGVWGILEVSYHPDRYEKDAEKDNWFKKSGILCIQHYTAERCYNESGIVVSEFIDILAKYKR